MFGEDHPYTRVSGPQARAIVALLDSMADADGGEEITEKLILSERRVFEYDDEVLYVNATRWFGAGGRNRNVELYLAKDGTEIVRKQPV